MAQIFISYKNEERADVAVIAHALEAEGFTVWWDNALVGGQDYAQVIDSEIAAAKVVMPIWSKVSVKSRWVSAEAERGWEKLVPVQIDQVNPPLPYNKLHTLDLTDWKGDRADPRWQRLVLDLRAIVSGRAPLHAPPLLAPRKFQRGILVASLLAVVIGGAVLAGMSPVVRQWVGVSPSETAAVNEGGGASEAPVPATADTPVQAEIGAGGGASQPVTTERGIRTYAEATTAVRQNGGQIGLDICTASLPRSCGLTNVRVGTVIVVRVTSAVAGRLYLLDMASTGASTQIFPNGLSRSGSELLIEAGQTVELPATGQGFVFGVSEPVGPSRLTAMILPVETPVPQVVAENVRVRGIQAIPADRMNDFAAPISAALSDNSRAVALGELNYVVTR